MEQEETLILNEIKRILDWEDPFHAPDTVDISCSEEYHKLIDRILRLKLENFQLNFAFDSTESSLHTTDMLNPCQKLVRDIDLSSKNPEMADLISTARHIAPISAGVLLTGESGTGKSLLARYIHANSCRSQHRFIELNCAAIPEALMESELFGYEAGAFTGANSTGKFGLIELAHQGTLFLDEIGDMPLSLQAKLLQVLQDKRITRVGGSQEIDVDIRIISATNQDLKTMIHDGRFRRDLYYRLNIIPLHVPTLRERRADIIPLARHFVHQFNIDNRKDVSISNAACSRLKDYSWPGNIRELENLMEYLVATNRDGFIREESLPENIRYGSLSQDVHKLRGKNASLPDLMAQVEQRIIQDAYKKYGNSYRVAEALGISQSSANRKIMKYVPRSSRLR